MRHLYSLICGLISIVPVIGAENLHGTWTFQLDPGNKGIREAWHTRTLKDTIMLPGTTDEAGFGEKQKANRAGRSGCLSRSYKYIGPAWYSRTITVPAAWANKRVQLFLERTIWKTTVWVDKKKIGSADSLATPHHYILGVLPPGEHRLTIRVDNSMIHNIGNKGHAYSESMQTIWNGIVGRIELSPLPDVNIANVKTYPDSASSTLGVVIDLGGDVKKASGGDINVSLAFDNKVVVRKTVAIPAGAAQVRTDLAVPNVKLWDDEAPNLYSLTTTLNGQRRQDSVGFRSIRTKGAQILVNDIPTFMRGNLDNCHFPLTGYPSMDAAGWERIFRILKSYGLNHVRFHSWCPPEAAFIAADRVGMFLQPEAGVWIDRWMGRSVKGVGRDPEGADKFIRSEMARIIDTYGNHPSFTFFCIGNELGSADFEVISQWIAELKAQDSRRLYSCTTARRITPSCDYSVNHNVNGPIRGVRGGSTNWTFDGRASKSKVPLISHELGQWPIYPLWEEIDKYTGTLKASNYEAFKKTAAANGVLAQNREFQKASGNFNQLLYKYEIESALRTKAMAGFQLLGIQDYSGQGEALIGTLDSFYDSKGIVTPERFREYCNSVVPLLFTPKFTWTNSEHFTGHVHVANYGKQPLDATTIQWVLADTTGTVLKSGKQAMDERSCGSVDRIFSLNVNLSSIKQATQATLTVSLDGTPYRNRWDLWIVPDEKPLAIPEDVLFVHRLDDTAIDALKAGKRVLFMPKSSAFIKAKRMSYLPVYWSTRWVPNQHHKGLGLLVQDKHPALAEFPTSFHSNWQWEHLAHKAIGFYFSGKNPELKPIVQTVPDFHSSEKFGSLFEVRIGAGKLLACGFDIVSDLETRPMARQLRNSLVAYLKGDTFNPVASMSTETLRTMFPDVKVVESVEPPSEFENAVLHIKAAGKIKAPGEWHKWAREFDDVRVAKEGTTYVVKGRVRSNRKKERLFWSGKGFKLEITCPKGILGEIMIHLYDITGVVTFEGRPSHAEDHGKDGIWLKFDVMREDTLDGTLDVEFESRQWGLKVTELVLTGEH